MRTAPEQRPGTDAYSQEPARISQNESKATAARFTVFQDLAAVGVGHDQTDDIVSKLEAGGRPAPHPGCRE